MPSNGDASVTPLQPWTEDGTAVVAPLPPFPDLVPRTLPLDNRPAGDHYVKRSEFPLGLVIVQTGHEPQETPAVLPVVAASGSQYHVQEDNYVNWPDGFVIWFTTQ